MYTMKTILAASLLGGISVFNQGFAQEDQPLGFSYVYQKPEKFAMLPINIPLMHFTLGKTNTSLYDVKPSIYYLGAGRVNGGISFRYGLGDKVMPKTLEKERIIRDDHMMSVNKPGKSMDFSAQATVFLKEAKKSKIVSLSLSESRTTSYYTKVEVDVLVKHGLTIGYNQGHSWYNMNNQEIDLVHPATNMETTVKFNSMSSVQEFKIIKFGYQHTRTINSMFEVEKYGERAKSSIVVTGVNFMYALTNKFDDVLVGKYIQNDGGDGKMHYAQFNFASTNALINFGGEFYQQYYIKHSPISLEYRIALLPGLKGILNYALSIGGNIQIDALRKNSK